MTIAEHLNQKGRQEERSEIARSFLSLGTDRALVEQATGLSSAELDTLMDSTAKPDH